MILKKEKMEFFGKQVPVDKINFVTNIISFILGVIFFIRMQYKLSEPSIPPNYNAERDSLISIQSRVNTQLKEIKSVQDSIIKTIRNNQEALVSQNRVLTTKRRQLFATLNSDWDELSPKEQSEYLIGIGKNLKQSSK